MILKNWLYNRVISISLKNPPPESVQPCLAAAQARNHYCVHLKDKLTLSTDPENDSRQVYILNHANNGYRAIYFNKGTHDGFYVTVLKRSIHEHEIEVRHILDGYTFWMNSAVLFILSHYLRLHQFRIFYDKLAQRIFNRRRLTRFDRIEILRIFVDRTTEDRRYSTSNVNLVQDINSIRSFGHPQKQAILNYYALLLESLKADRYLSSTSNQYRLTGEGHAALERFEIEERRHRSSIRQQTILATLTLVLACVGIAQVWVTYTKG